MIDLETLGITPQAPVISIGAVLFDLESGAQSDKFFQKIDINSALNGRAPDGNTIKWWMSQSDEARSEFDGPNDMRASLVDFTKFTNRPFDGVWSNGSCFDIMIMEDLFHQYEISIPWKFYQIMDMRTIKFLADPCPIIREGTHHNALADAEYQAQCVSWMWQNLENNAE